VIEHDFSVDPSADASQAADVVGQAAQAEAQVAQVGQDLLDPVSLSFEPPQAVRRLLQFFDCRQAVRVA